MIITAWRILKSKHAAYAFTGEGNFRHGSRWVSKDRRVIYTADTLALAQLETMVHMENTATMAAYVCCSISFDEELVEVLPESKLPDGWNNIPAPVHMRAIGDQWFEDGNSVVLKVPSVTVPLGEGWNYIINVVHDDFASLTRKPPEPIEFDQRIIGQMSRS